jgi:hypothetical protein
MSEQLVTGATPQRKLLGAFYTEGETAGAIAQLAVTSANEAVFDPCFGGCAFLEAVRLRLRSLGKTRPMDRVFGVDVDPGALNFLREVRGARSAQFLVKDFLDVSPQAFRAPFDVVVGNPPFVRHHLLSDDAVRKGQAGVARDLKVPRTADSWLYFLHHSLKFLRPGGCLAMVLPGALLNATYAATAREMIATRFASSDLFLVRRRLFPDALESPVIVVARGFGEKPQGARLSIVDSPRDIVPAFNAGTGHAVDLTEKTGPWRLALLSSSARAALSAVTHRTEVSQLGAIGKIHIGVVTGANRFFIVSDSEARTHGLPDSRLHPILSTSKQFRGLELRRGDMSSLRKADERVLLLQTAGRRGAALDAYLESAPAQTAKGAFKCRDRDVWHDVADASVPDAFLTYVIDRGPRLVLNRAKALCTNAIHRVWWREKPKQSIAEGWALSMASCLGGLSAELYGRACGGGALKLEPSEAAAIWVPKVFRRHAGLERAFQAASNALARGEWERARDIADRAILRDELGLAPAEVADLRSAHDTLLDLRFSIAARETRRQALRGGARNKGH